MDENLPDEYNCPICFEIPRKEIYQCENGHTVCSKCSISLTQCPQCRIWFEGRTIRNRALEKLLDKAKFNCSNKNLGCKERLTRQEIDSHAEYCTFGNIGIKLCHLFGFPCDFVLNTKEASIALSHFKMDHGFIVCKNAAIDICFADTLNFPKIHRSYWTPVIFDQLEASGTACMLVILFNKETKSMTPICINITEDNNDQALKLNGRIEFVTNAMENIMAPDIAWSTTVFNLKHAKFIMEHPSVGVALDTLNSFYAKESTLIVSCSLKIENLFISKTKTNEQIYVFNNSYVMPQNQARAPSSTSAPSGSLLPNQDLPQNMFQEHYIGRRTLQLELPQIQGLQIGPQQTQRFPLKSPIFLPTNAIPEYGPAGNEVFSGTLCDLCGQTPSIARYKCLQCEDYDLCGPCMRREEHEHHIFAILLNKKQANLLRSILADSNNSWRPFFPQGSQPLHRHSVASSPKCCKCTLVSKYICLICRTFCGFCVACFSIYSGDHMKDHPFAVANTETKLRFIMDRMYNYTLPGTR